MEAHGETKEMECLEEVVRDMSVRETPKLKVTLQNNLHDCGVMTIFHAEVISRGVVRQYPKILRRQLISWKKILTIVLACAGKLH